MSSLLTTNYIPFLRVKWKAVTEKYSSDVSARTEMITPYFTSSNFDECRRKYQNVNVRGWYSSNKGIGWILALLTGWKCATKVAGLFVFSLHNSYLVIVIRFLTSEIINKVRGFSRHQSYAGAAYNVEWLIKGKISFRNHPFARKWKFQTTKFSHQKIVFSPVLCMVWRTKDSRQDFLRGIWKMRAVEPPWRFFRIEEINL